MSLHKCLGSLEVTAARSRDFCAEISILGSRGLAQIGGIAVNELQIYLTHPRVNPAQRIFLIVFMEWASTALLEIASDLDNSNEGYNYSISLEDAFKTISFLDACYRSIEENSMVKVQCDNESKKLEVKSKSLRYLQAYLKKERKE